MDEFEQLLECDRAAVERFVRYRVSMVHDADDILQEVYITAYSKFPQLKNKESFKPWIISIARNKCTDYFRRMAKQYEIPIDVVAESEMSYGRRGVSIVDTVREVVEMLGDRDKQILYLYFWKELPQAEIAKRLGIPLGTVKSRLHTAKQNFKNKYPYNIPSRKCDHVYDMQVTGKAKVHGIEGVELTAREASYSDKTDVVNRTFVAQLTDTHCRYLATLRNDGDVRNYITFLDGDEFMPNWGFGEDNCGNETNLSQKGDVTRIGTKVNTADKDFLLDIVGRYTVTIGGRRYDTVCVMDIETYNCGVVSEQYLDINGRTILWRRFNKNDWAYKRYGKLWTEMLPENDRLDINGETYVHWYDCITDYIL